LASYLFDKASTVMGKFYTSSKGIHSVMPPLKPKDFPILANFLLSTYILIAEPLHAAVEKAGLADGYGQVARHIKVEVGQQIGGRDCCCRRGGRRGRQRSAVS